MMIRKWLLAVLLVVPLTGGCGKKDDGGAAADGKDFKSPWTFEEHWMVANVVLDLQGMATLAGAKAAADPTVPGKADHEFLVGGVKLAMSPSCWDPASYRQLLKIWKPAAQISTDPAPDLVHDLLTPTATALQKANDTVSNRIKAAPADPLVHEEAAFLLGVFGIRENARCFTDLRPLLCRMTAHLAFAGHLRGGAKSPAIGQWAQVLFDYHAGRPLKARELMERIPVEGDSGRWKRVVELLITGDWRRTGDLAEPSLAEAIAHARALREHRGNPQMLEFVTQRKDLQAIPEWSRLLASPGNSVQDGHIVMKSAMSMEFLEIAEIFHTGKQPQPEKLAKFLTRESPAALVGKEGSPRVISDGDWAAYFRRHIFTCCWDVSRFAQRMWSSHEAAVEWEKYVLPYCRKLPGHELIEPMVSTGVQDYQTDLRATAEFIRNHPEQVPTGLWFDYRFPFLEAQPETSMPGQVPWFREVSPPATAHDPRRRIRFEGIQGGEWMKHVAALHAIDPWSSELCFELAENTGNNSDSVKRAWGIMREYSVLPLNQTLRGPALTPDERIETLQTLINFDPESGLKLGYSLVMAGRPEEAIKAYEIAYQDADDRVAVSNQCQWMIHYYKSKGHDAKAREIADHNADVYSSKGLVSALALAIEEKDAKRAKEYADAISERYNDSRYLPVAAWCAGGDEKTLRQTFPDGLKEVTAADIDVTKPVKGVQIMENSVTVRTVGLKAGDVVVAVDGKRVEDYVQYLMLMSAKLDPHTRFLYKRGKKIEEINCVLPERRLDADVAPVGK